MVLFVYNIIYYYCYCWRSKNKIVDFGRRASGDNKPRILGKMSLEPPQSTVPHERSLYNAFSIQYEKDDVICVSDFNSLSYFVYKSITVYSIIVIA